MVDMGLFRSKIASLQIALRKRLMMICFFLANAYVQEASFFMLTVFQMNVGDAYRKHEIQGQIPTASTAPRPQPGRTFYPPYDPYYTADPRGFQPGFYNPAVYFPPYPQYYPPQQSGASLAVGASVPHGSERTDYGPFGYYYEQQQQQQQPFAQTSVSTGTDTEDATVNALGQLRIDAAAGGMCFVCLFVCRFLYISCI